MEIFEDGGPSSSDSTITTVVNQETRIAPKAEPEDSRYCWVCFATDEDGELSPWVQPCSCKGNFSS